MSFKLELGKFMKMSLRMSTGLALLVSVTACGGSPSPEAELKASLPAATQVAAFEACSSQLSVPAHLQQLELDNDRVNVFAVNSNGVTLAQARSLNQCARARIAAQYG
jgi:hypothetical protein